jgi:SAM-dependent methyltransferase
MSDGQRGWADFWKADCAASCEPEYPETALEIARLWQGWLARCADGSRVLDVATGNGIVLAHAAAAARARGRRFALTGIDRAEIDPPRYLRNLDPALRAATFLGGVAAESLPFADGSFDVVVSQYGLEYADLERALAEAARVLVPGGALVWLAHADGSEIARQHRGQAKELDFLLAPGGPVAAMHAMVARQRVGQDITAALDACRSDAMQFSRAHPPASIIREVLEGFTALLSSTGGHDAVAAVLTEAERRLRTHRDRIGSLLDAVLTPDRLGRVRTRLSESPWTALETNEVRVGNARSLIGTLITAEKVPT